MGKNVGNGYLKLHDLERVTPAFHQRERKSQLAAGDVVVVRIGNSGQAALVPASLGEANCSGLVVLKQPTKVDASYLVHFLNSPEGRKRSLAEAKGSTRQTLNTKVIATAEIPLPPLAEQRRIAEVLDRAETLLTKRRAALAQLDILTQSIFLDMFGDIERNARGMPRMPIADVVLGHDGVKAGPFGSSLKKSDYATSGYRVYGQEQVIAGRFDVGNYYVGERKYQQLKSCAVHEGDVLLSLVGSFGKALAIPSGVERGIINPRLLKIRPDPIKVRAEYLVAFMGQSSTQRVLARMAHGGTMPILNVGLIKRLDILVPPLDVQDEFVGRLAAVNFLVRLAEDGVTQLDTLLASLQHRAFRGEL
jgi:type I restriction enzyme S subunit